MPAEHRDLARALVAACYLEGSFTLRSGTTSDHYFDKYRFEAEPTLLREVAEALLPSLPPADLIAGPELGGVPLAVALSAVSGLPCRFVRKTAKTYGTAQLAEGGPVDGQRIVMVEDVVSTGGQLVESIGALRELGATVDAAMVVVLRDPVGRENLAAIGVDTIALFSEDELDLPSGR